jgi:adenylosuccinate lyase
MPHKVNPIDFENAEGNFGLANALLTHLSQKLPISRWQRDLTDSTVLRNMGVALGYAVLGYDSLAARPGQAGAQRDGPGRRPGRRLGSAGRAIQTVMRRHGLPEPYEQLKAFTRGKPMTRALMQGFIANLALPQAEKDRLLAMTPPATPG